MNCKTKSTIVVLVQPWEVVLAYGGHGGSGVGVTLEVSAPPLRDG